MTDLLVPRPNQGLLEGLFGFDPYLGFEHETVPLDLLGSSETALLCDVLEAYRPELIVEVGSWKGESAVAMGRKLRSLGLDSPIVCIDTWLGCTSHFLKKNSPGHFPSLRMFHGYPQVYYTFLANVLREHFEDLIVPLPQTSSSAARILGGLGARPQVVYIDGSHYYEDVLLDLNLFWDLLEEPGCIVGDDYHWTWETVAQAGRDFAASRHLDLHIRGTQFYLAKGSVFIPSGCRYADARGELYWDLERGDYIVRPRT
jgi:hypothetical protein